MSLNDTVSAERLHIGFFGMRNAGKSSVVNAVTGQQLALVSDVKGTTTDPVKKAMELLPLGPVVIIDTPGIDDEGELGRMRVERAVRVLAQTDIAILIVDGTEGLRQPDEQLLSEFRRRNIPYIIVYNKSDLFLQPVPADGSAVSELPDHRPGTGQNSICVSARTGENIHELKELIGSLSDKTKNEKQLVGDLIVAGDTVVLVTPIDESAPKGRLILPQQQMIRDILDHNGINLVVQVPQLAQTLSVLQKKPRMVITDSQAFAEVSRIVPDDIPMTSFSILFARYKGELFAFAEGAEKLDALEDGDVVLLSEGCTHHRQCNDIGTVKLPGWIQKYTGKKLQFAWTSGVEFPSDLSRYALVIHCGACMLNEREVRSRMRIAADAGVPMTNYGIAIAHMNGILERPLSVFS